MDGTASAERSTHPKKKLKVRERAGANRRGEKGAE